LQNRDCGASSTCTGLVCTPECANGAKDGQETDTDCGGGTCATCADGRVCKANGDCGTSSVCKSLICTAQCADGTKDGQETDTDCGGGTCATCADGRACKVNGDCGSSSVCKTSTKTCTAQCADGTQDGAETDQDCGGGTCLGCGAGKTCNVNGDCASGLACMPAGGGGKTCQ
jgi:hypothetical protein